MSVLQTFNLFPTEVVQQLREAFEITSASSGDFDPSGG